MAQYEISFDAVDVGTYPSFLTRRWSTSQAAPSVAALASPVLGQNRALSHTLSAASRQLDSVTAIESDADRADVKFRSLIYTANPATVPGTSIWAAVLRASGNSGAETGYTVAISRQTTTVYSLLVNRYVAGAATLTYDSPSGASWSPDTWYVLEGDISGDNPVVLNVRLYAITDLDTPIVSWTFSDSSASRITAAGWVGIGRFSSATLTRNAYAAFATGTSELPAAPWEAADTTAPTLTGPTATATGTTTASGTVSTNEATGTLYWIASANATESAATVKAGGSQAVSATGTQSVSVSGLTASASYYLHYLHRDGAGNDSDVASSAQFTTEAEVVAVKGASIALYNGSTPQASITGIRALWWDVTAPDATPDYYTASASTDASGVLTLDLDAATALAIGDYGYLLLHKDGTLGNLYRDALEFAGAVQITDIS